MVSAKHKVTPGVVSMRHLILVLSIVAITAGCAQDDSRRTTTAPSTFDPFTPVDIEIDSADLSISGALVQATCQHVGIVSVDDNLKFEVGSPRKLDLIAVSAHGFDQNTMSIGLRLPQASNTSKKFELTFSRDSIRSTSRKLYYFAIDRRTKRIIVDGEKMREYLAFAIGSAFNGIAIQLVDGGVVRKFRIFLHEISFTNAASTFSLWSGFPSTTGGVRFTSLSNGTTLTTDQHIGIVATERGISAHKDADFISLSVQVNRRDTGLSQMDSIGMKRLGVFHRTIDIYEISRPGFSNPKTEMVGNSLTVTAVAGQPGTTTFTLNEIGLNGGFLIGVNRVTREILVEVNALLPATVTAANHNGVTVSTDGVSQSFIQVSQRSSFTMNNERRAGWNAFTETTMNPRMFNGKESPNGPNPKGLFSHNVFTTSSGVTLTP